MGPRGIVVRIPGGRRHERQAARRHLAADDAVRRARALGGLAGWLGHQPGTPGRRRLLAAFGEPELRAARRLLRRQRLLQADVGHRTQLDRGGGRLGPLYNARSCQGCHLKDGRGHPPEGPGDGGVSMFLRLSIPPQNDADRACWRAIGRPLSASRPTARSCRISRSRARSARGRMAIAYEELPVELAAARPSRRAGRPTASPTPPMARCTPRPC